MLAAGRAYQELGRAPALADREYRSRLKAEALIKLATLGVDRTLKQALEDICSIQSS
jgi:hypothetical protein